MAELDEIERKILRGSAICVTVDEALEDVVVVSFTYGSKIFQGVLLDVTKRNIPYGICFPKNNFDGLDGDKDSMLSGTAMLENQTQTKPAFPVLRERHTYFQETPQIDSRPFPRSRRDISKSFNNKNVRTMRLRPRQVLCSKCKSICNENSESVENPLQQQAQQNLQQTSVTIPHSQPVVSVPITPVSITSLPIASVPIAPVLIAPASVPVTPIQPPLSVPSQLPFHQQAYLQPQVLISSDDVHKMTLRKRKPLQEEQQTQTDSSPKKPKKLHNLMETQTITKTSPIIKISFTSPQGEGTVVKIPPRAHNYTYPDHEEEPQIKEEFDLQKQSKDANLKAAKKALKKARKEAQRKAGLLAASNGQSLHHNHRHHKHKFKHKHKHKHEIVVDEAKHKHRIAGIPFDSDKCEKKEITTTNNTIPLNGQKNGIRALSIVNSERVLPSESYSFDDHSNSNSSSGSLKDKNFNQKLSLNLKLCVPESKHFSSVYNSSGSSHNSSRSSSKSNSSDTNSNSDQSDLYQFPENEPPKNDKVEKLKPLMMRIQSRHVTKCTLPDGKTMSVGDIVWGKIHGFPWWPGKVISITISQRDNGVLITQQAHVAWFGSSTSSFMPCSQLVPFLDNFKMRYNKKKRGPYKEAIKQATIAARQMLSEMQEVDVESMDN